MKQQPSFMQLISDLEKNFHVSFGPGDSKAETNGKIFALEASKQKNLELIDKEFSEVVTLIQIKLPYIQSLVQLNEELDRQIEQLKLRQPPARQGAAV